MLSPSQLQQGTGHLTLEFTLCILRTLQVGNGSLNSARGSQQTTPLTGFQDPSGNSCADMAPNFGVS